MNEKASSKTIPTKTLGELLDSFREYVQEILEINEPQTNLLIAKARQKRFIDANVLRQKLQEFKVENEGTSETNASCCCHFESRVNYECPLKKMLLVGLEPEEAKK